MIVTHALIYAAVAIPFLLTALALWPVARARLIHSLPFAALPALAEALVVPAGTTVPLPTVLLGAELMLDAPARLFLGIAALLWTLAGLYARSAVRDDGRGRFAGFWLSTLSGNVLLLLAGDLITFYLAFAALSLSAFGLVVHNDTAEARRAARIYLALAILGETFLLLGLMLAVNAAGSVMIADVRAALPTAPQRDLALALLIAGFGLKAGLVPLHVWLPLAHPAAPVPASAILSGALVKAGIFGLIKFLPFEADLPGWNLALVGLGLFTAYYGALIGLCQSRPKTVLAYSTLSQMGLVVTVLGAGIGSPDVGLAVAAAGLYAAHHSLAKGALFLSVGVLHESSGRTRAWMLAAAAIAALAIAGLPFTGGAIAKLVIKGPVGTGAAGLLVTLSAIGTTLLMIRFLLLVGRDHAPAGARPDPARSVPFLLCVAGALTLPWLLLPEVDDLTAAYALSATNLWAAAWPMLTALALIGVGQLLRLTGPIIPEGDIVVPGERGFDRMAAGATSFRMPKSKLSVPSSTQSHVAGLLAFAETRLTQWGFAGLILLTGLLGSLLTL